MSANNTEEFTRYTIDSSFYSLADEGIRRNFEAREITKGIDWQSYSHGVVRDRDFVGAFTDDSDADQIDELQGDKYIGDGTVLQDDATT